MSLQKRVCEPHAPQVTFSVTPGVVHASDMHAPAGSYSQLALQSTSRLSVVPHPSPLRDRVPGAHEPCSTHSPPTSHTHATVQRAACVPQFPHATSPKVP